MNIAHFVTALTNRLNEYKAKSGFTYFDHYKVEVTEGQKFFKVFSKEVRADGSAPYRSIVAFVDKVTGDIFMPASFKAPAKHARGNVSSPQHGMEAITECGRVKYLS